MNKEITEKIRKLRMEKGFSQNDMAKRLNITRSAYYNLESGDGYSWARYLGEIMEILDTSPKDFFQDIGGKLVQQNNCSFTEGAIGYVETLHQENREVYEKLLAAKDDQIAFLKNLVDKKS